MCSTERRRTLVTMCVSCVSYEEEDTCAVPSGVGHWSQCVCHACHMRRRIHVQYRAASDIGHNVLQP